MECSLAKSSAPLSVRKHPLTFCFYLDFPQFYTVSNGEIGFIRKDEINKMTNDEKNQIYAYIKPDEDELSQEISGIITVPLDIVIYPNITVDGNHIDDLYINFTLTESPFSN